MDIGLNQRKYIGTEGHNVTVCAKVDKGVIERTVSVYLSAFSGTANGKCCVTSDKLNCIFQN